MSSGGSATLLAEADRAAAAGQLNVAQQILLEAVKAADAEPATFLKLAGLQRADGQPKRALETVLRALAIAPLDFTALLMRASLLDRLNDPAAGGAWEQALSQKPEGEIPPHLAAVVAQGEQRAEEWRSSREQRMKAAMSAIEEHGDEEQRARIERFRNNTLRRTRPYHSKPTDFHYPGLPEREFHPRRLFPWIASLEAATETIIGELKAVMSAERAELVPYVQYEDHVPMDQWRPLNKNPDWTAIHLLQHGEPVEANVLHCPATMEVLRQIPQPFIVGASPNAMFSLLAPHTAIPPHVGVNNARLVCHLPLIVPEGCWFRVGAETRYWRPGEAFVFDDTIEHEAANPTDQLRVVLILDVWNPDLSALECDAVAALIGAERTGHGQGL